MRRVATLNLTITLAGWDFICISCDLDYFLIPRDFRLVDYLKNFYFSFIVVLYSLQFGFLWDSLLFNKANLSLLSHGPVLVPKIGWGLVKEFFPWDWRRKKLLLLQNRQNYLLSQCIILHMDIDWKSIIIKIKKIIITLTGNWKQETKNLQETNFYRKQTE